MRLKEDNTSWKSRGIKRRDFRHTYGEPETPAHRKDKKKPRPKKDKHKHVWVEVDFKEYQRYATRRGGMYRFPWWLYPIGEEPKYWQGYTTYFVCADCLDTKTKVDEGKRRAHYRRAYGRR